jgi:hypothetical protein
LNRIQVFRIMRSKQDILKHDYLVNNFERGEGKTKETMVLASFCLDIRLKAFEPKFQFPLRKAPPYESDYLYDLYYPALNSIVEVDEEHHEHSKDEDIEKERWAASCLKCDFYRIKFHIDHGNLIDQIENVKVKLLEKAKSKSCLEWVINQFDAEQVIQEYAKTLFVFVSDGRKFEDLPKFPLQISHSLRKVPDLNVIYFTGGTKTVAQAFKVPEYDHWADVNGSLIHKGIRNSEHPILVSGHTLYNKNENILWSPDLNDHFKSRMNRRRKKLF